MRSWRERRWRTIRRAAWAATLSGSPAMSRITSGERSGGKGLLGNRDWRHQAAGGGRRHNSQNPGTATFLGHEGARGARHQKPYRRSHRPAAKELATHGGGDWLWRSGGLAHGRDLLLTPHRRLVRVSLRRVG